MFRVFSGAFLSFSSVFTVVERGEKALVFWMVFLGVYLNTKEWKIRVSTKGGVSHHFGGVLTSLKKYRAIWGIAAIVSQYRAIWGHSLRAKGALISEPRLSTSGVNKSARERIGRQNFSQKVPSKKGSLGVIFSPRNYRENAHSKSAKF